MLLPSEIAKYMNIPVRQKPSRVGDTVSMKVEGPHLGNIIQSRRMDPAHRQCSRRATPHYFPAVDTSAVVSASCCHYLRRRVFLSSPNPHFSQNPPRFPKETIQPAVFFTQRTHSSAYNKAASTERTYAATKLFDPLRRV